MAKWKKILITTLVVIVVLGITKNIVITQVVKMAAGTVVGAPVKIKSIAVGVFRPGISIKGFKMYNPKGFPKELMVDIPEITVRYKPLSIFKGKIHLTNVVVNLNKMVLIKDKDGKLNVDALKISQKKEAPEEKKEAPKKKKPAKKMGIYIEEARLSLGKVIVKDFTAGDPPLILAYNIGVNDKVYKNIKSAEHLATLIMLEAMGPAGLKGAAIYGAASILGVAFLPAGVAGILLGKDHAVAEYKTSLTKSFDVVSNLMQKIGEGVKEDKKARTIKAKVYGHDISIEFSQNTEKKTEIKVKARKMMLPKSEVAEGIIFQISDKLK